MGELLPLLCGLALGGVAGKWLQGRRRAVFLVVSSVIAGVLASAVNGELASGWWAAFVSFDSLLVWAGAACSISVLQTVRWFHASA